MAATAARMRRLFVLTKRSAYDMFVARHQDPAFTHLILEPLVRRGCSFSGMWSSNCLHQQDVR